MSNLLLSRIAVVVIAAMFGLSYSLSGPLIALKLTERGIDNSVIGLNAAMHAVGVLLIAPLLAGLVGRFGARRLVLFALALAAVVLATFATAPPLWAWFPLRLLLGMASELLFVLSETWTNQLSTEATRARAMAIYTATMSVGFALGPLILSLVGTGGGTAFLIGAASTLAAIALIASPRIIAPHFDHATEKNPLHHLARAPIAIAATTLNAAVETAGLSFLALYAMQNGWTETQGTNLVTVMMVGAIVLQLPIGWLGDRMDRKRLVLGLAILATVGAMLWPLVFREPALAFPLVFVWGGVFVGIYTMMLAVVGSRFTGADLVGIYAVTGLFWGGGALIGPTLAGFAMDRVPHGLPIFVALACALFCLLLLRSRSEA